MRKITTFALVIVMLVLMVSALVSCNLDPIVVPDNENPNKIPVEEVGAKPDAMQMLKIISASMSVPDGTANIDFSLPVTVAGKPYEVSLKGNLPTGETGSLEIALTVKDNGVVIFGMYITNGKMFIEVQDGFDKENLKFYIEDINFDEFYKLLSKLDFDELLTMVDGLLASSGLPLTVDSVIQLVGGLLFSVDSYKTTVTSQEIDLTMDIVPLLQMVAPLLPSLNIDGLLAGAGINVSGLGDFLSNLLNSIPNFKVNIHSVIINGENKVFDVALNTASETVKVDVSINFSNENGNIDMPSSFDEYEPFSLTNIAFNLNFGIKTTNLDVGKLINRFIPNTLPENLLVFTSDRQFVLKLNMDLDPKDNNKNLILLELYRGNDPNANEKRLLGAYFIDGSLKINVDELSSAIAVPNIEIKGLNLSSVVGGLFDLISNTIEGAINSITGGDAATVSNVSTVAAQSRDNFIIPLSVDDAGVTYISPSISSFVNSLVGVFGMTDFVVLDGDSLTITVNDAFFDALVTLVPSLESTLSGFPSIGEAILAVNFFNKGIHDIDLTYRPNADEDYINLNLNNFLFGFSTPSLKKTITERTYGKEYANNVQDLLNGALDGVSLGGSISLGIKQGTYDLAEMLKMFVTLPSMKFSVPQDINITAKLKMQLSYDAQNIENSKGLFEIWLEDDFVFLSKGKLLGVYIVGNDLYLEVNGIGSLAVPKVKVHTDFLTLLHDEIAKLDLDFVLDGLLDNIIPSSLSTVGDVMAADGNVDGGTAYDSILNILNININEEALNLRITSLGIQSLLAKFGVTLELPYIDITAEMRELNDIKIGANLMNMLNLNLIIDELNIGKSVDVELPTINEDEYCGDLQELVNGIMKGADLNLDLQLKLNQGFDIVAMIEEMGAILPIDINAVLESDVVLDVNLKLQLAYDATNINNSKFLLEITLKQDVLFLKAGKLIGVYGQNGKLYIDIAPIQGVKVPNIELDIDILQLLSDAVSSLDVDFILQMGGGAQPASMNAVADNSNDVGFDDNFNLIIHQDYIKLYVTGMALNELLESMGLGGVTLPEFSAEINVTDIDDVTIDLKLIGKMSFHGEINAMTIGREVFIELPVINEDEYTPSLDKIVAQLFNGVHMEAGIKAELKAGEYNIAYLLQMFGVVIPDAYIKIPVSTTLELKAVFKMSYDELNPSNSKILLEIYVLNDVLKLINKSDTVPFIAAYGIGSMLYLELNNLNNINIPKVKVEADLFGLILDEVGKLDLQEIIKGLVPSTQSLRSVNGLSAVADSDFNIVIDRETLMIATTFRAIANLLDTAGITAEIPDFDITAEINGIDSIKLSADGVLNFLDLSLTFGVKNLGTPVIVDLPPIDPSEYSGNLTELVTGALDGVDAEINLKLDLYKGVYDIADMLSGIPGLNMPPISLDVTEDTSLDLTLKIQMKYDAVNPENSKALLEFTLNRDVVFAKAGKLLSVYAFDGYIFLELANFNGITIPKVKVECDLMQLLKEELDKLDVNFIINGSKNQNDETTPAAFNTINGGVVSVLDVEATINTDSLRFAVTSHAIAAVLAKMGINLTLPEFDIKADIKSLGEMSFDINLDSILSASLSVNSLVIGDSNVNVNIPEGINKDDYVGNLQNLINGILEGIELEATMDLSLKKGEYNLASLLSLFKGIAAPDMKFTVTEDTVLSITLKIQIKNDALDSTKSSALIELYINNDVLIFNKGLLLGLYAANGKTYLEVSPNGAIDGIKVPKIVINNDLFGELKRIIEDNALDFKLDISGIVKGNQSETPSVKSVAALLNGNDSITATIDQNSLKIAVTAHAIAQLLEQFGIKIALPDMDITAEIKNLDDITINLGFMSLLYADLHISKLNIGNIVNVDLPIINEDEYAGDLSGLVTNLLDGVSLEASLDLTITPEFDINKIINALGLTIEMPNINLNINQPITLGARLLLQLDYNKANPAQSNGLFEIWLTALDLPPIFDVEGSKNKPFIGAYIENSKVYLEVNNIVGVSLPKIMLDCDVFGLLNEIIAKNNVEFVIDFGNSGVATTALNDGAYAAQDVIDIGINPDALQFKATLMAVMELLDYLGIQLAIPEIPLDVDLTVSSLSNISLSVSALEMLNLSLKITDFKFGDSSLSIDLSNKILKDANGNVIDDAYNADLSNVLGDILNGIDLRANLRLEVLNTFDLGEFISGFGVELPNLDIAFPQGMVLDITLTVQVKYDKSNPTNTRVLIELMNNEKTLFFNKGLLFGLYMFGNDAYIMIGGKSVDGSTNNENEMGGIAGIKIPTIKLHTDIMDLLSEELAKIDIGFVIDSNTLNPTQGGKAAPMSSVVPCDSVNVSLDRDSLKLAATSAALQELFNRLGLSIGFELPQFDLTAEIKSLSDIKISLAGVDTINLDLTMLGLTLGDNNLVITGMPDLSDVTFSDNIPDIIGEILQGVDINAYLNLTVVGNEYNLATILKDIAGLNMPDLMFTVDADDDSTNGYQDINLKTQIKLQLNFDMTDPSKSRALFEIYLLEDIAIAKASTTVPLLGLYISGSNIYLEINNLENVRIPKIKIQADIMTMLADMVKGLNLDFNISLKDLINGGAPVDGGNAVSSVADVDLEGLDNIEIAINNDAIKFNATSAAITQLLSTFGLGLSLPDMNITGELANINGGSLSMKLNGGVMDFAKFDFNLDYLSIGEYVQIDKIDNIIANDYQYDNGLADLVGTMLEGIDIKGNANLDIPAGDYDIGGFLSSLGIAGIPPLVLSFTKDIVMESEFKFQLNYDSIMPSNSKGLIEWTVTNPQEFMFIDAPEGVDKVTVLGIYIDGEAIYVDLSNVVISNIRLPKVKINIDLFTSLIDMLKSLNVDFVFDLVSGGANAGVQSVSYNQGLNAVADTNDTIILGFSSQALHLKASAMAIQLLLAQFGIEIALPEMDLSVDITELTGINVAFSAAISDKNVNVNLSNIKSNFGQKPSITLPDNYKNDKAYGTTLADTIINIIGDVDITGQIDIKANNSSFDLRKLINSVLALTEQSFDIPLNVNFDNFSNIINFDIKWHLDRYNPGDTLAAITIYSSDGGLAISIFHKNNRLYVDLSSLGLMKFYIDNFNLTGLIKSILSGLSPIMSTDIGTLLDDMLQGLVNPVAVNTEIKTLEEIAKAAADKERLNAAVMAAAEGDETIDLISLILSTLDITDTLISLDFNKTLVSELIEKAGIYLGIDLYGGIQFDLLKGTLDGNAQIDDLALGFDVNINKFGEFDSMKNNIRFPNFKEDKTDGKYPMTNEIPNQSEYASYELTSTMDFLLSVIGGVDYANPGTSPQVMWIDLTTRVDANRKLNYADQNGYGNGGAVKISVQRYTTAGTHNGNAVPKGGIVIGIYKNLNSTNPILWVYIDPSKTSGNIRLLGTSDLLYLLAGAVTGSLIDIWIDLDLSSLLGGVLDPIFGSLPEDMFIKNDNSIQGDENISEASLENTNGVVAAVADETPAASGDDALDIMSLFKNISVNFYSTATTKINVSLDGSVIDNLLTNVLHDLLYNLNLPQIGGAAHVNYAGTRTGEYAFFDELFAKIIKPFAKDAIGAAGGLFGLVEGSVYSQIFDVVRRLLPLPRMTDLNATVTLANSQIQSVDVISTHKDSDEFLKAHIHLAGAGATGVIDWGNIPGNVVKDPYSNDKITPQFNAGVAKAVQVNTTGGSHKNNPVITYGGHFNALKAMDESGNYTPGKYIITAEAYGETINIPVEILNKKAITQIMPIIVPAYGDIPDKIVATFEDGSVRTIKNVNIDVQKPAWNESKVLENVSVSLSDGTVLGTTSVTFIDGTVGSYTVDLYVDAYSKNSLLTALPKKAFVKYEYGYYSSVPITWTDTSQLSSLTNEEWINGRAEPYTITAVIDDGSDNPQQLIYNVYIRTINVESVKFEGEYYDDYLTVDPIQALKERNDIAALPEGSERPESNVFPSKAKITYTDGRSENLDIKWDNAEIDAIIYTLGGGDIELNIMNATGDMNWTTTRKINVNIMSRKIKYAKFGTNEDGSDKKILTINPYEYFARSSVIPSMVEAVFSEGASALVPCEWNIPINSITPKGGYVQADLIILPGTSMESHVKTLIEVEQVDVVGLDYPINSDGKPEYTFDKATEVLYGDGSMLEEGNTLLKEYAPKQLSFKLRNGETKVLPITSNFADIAIINAEGGIVRGVTVTIGTGLYAQSFVMDVKIPTSIVTGLAEGFDTVTIEKSKIISIGADAFPTQWYLQFGDRTVMVKVKWWLDNIDINSGGVAELLLGTDTPEPQDDQAVRIRVNVVDSLS